MDAHIGISSRTPCGEDLDRHKPVAQAFRFEGGLHGNAEATHYRKLCCFASGAQTDWYPCVDAAICMHNVKAPPGRRHKSETAFGWDQCDDDDDDDHHDQAEDSLGLSEPQHLISQHVCSSMQIPLCNHAIRTNTFVVPALCR